MSNVSPIAPLPSRRARRDTERAAGRSRSPRLPWRMTSAVAPRAIVLATIGGMAVGLPLAGFTDASIAPAHAAATVPAVQASLTDVVDTASATAETQGVGGSALSLDQAGQARVQVVAATAVTETTQVCGPVGGANGVTAALTTAPSAGPAIVQPMDAGSYRITSGYGPRVHPIFGDGRMHEGVDYAGAAGTPIYAVAAGTVIQSGPTADSAGTLVVIEHDVDGEVWTSWYLHMYAQDIAVAEGQQVSAGDLVGAVGSAGDSTGPHLHLEVHTGPGMGGPSVEPSSWLTERGAVEAGSSCA